MSDLADRLQAIVQEITEPDGAKECAIADCDFERAAALRDIADAIKKAMPHLCKPKRFATSREILSILENQSLELFEKLGVSSTEAQLSLKFKGPFGNAHAVRNLGGLLEQLGGVLLVAVKKGATKGATTKVEWELPTCLHHSNPCRNDTGLSGLQTP